MVTKKKTTKKQAKPKTKVVYRTKKVYVEKKDHDDNPFGETTKMVGQGMGALMGVTIGMGMIGAMDKALK
jgi:hypothetical protein